MNMTNLTQDSRALDINSSKILAIINNIDFNLTSASTRPKGK